MDLLLEESGSIHVQFKVQGEYVIEDSIYPLCGMTVQTTAFLGWDEVMVQPNTYLQRAFFGAE
jgi:hypothetical protein